MIEYKDCQRNDLLADAKKDPKKVQWLKDYVAELTTDKNGKERKKTWFETKRAYYEHFYPDQTPARKVKTKSFFDEIMEL